MSRGSKKDAGHSWLRPKIRGVVCYRALEVCGLVCAVKQEEVRTDTRGAGPRPGDKLRSVRVCRGPVRRPKQGAEGVKVLQEWTGSLPGVSPENGLTPDHKPVHRPPRF